LEYTKCNFISFKTHFGEIRDEIMSRCGNKINDFISLVTVLAISALVISCIVFPNWIAILVEIVIIILGLYNFVSH